MFCSVPPTYSCQGTERMKLLHTHYLHARVHLSEAAQDSSKYRSVSAEDVKARASPVQQWPHQKAGCP